jgi:hypothetical protein
VILFESRSTSQMSSGSLKEEHVSGSIWYDKRGGRKIFPGPILYTHAHTKMSLEVCERPPLSYHCADHTQLS